MNHHDSSSTDCDTNCPTSPIIPTMTVISGTFVCPDSSISGISAFTSLKFVEGVYVACDRNYVFSSIPAELLNTDLVSTGLNINKDGNNG